MQPAAPHGQTLPRAVARGLLQKEGAGHGCYRFQLSGSGKPSVTTHFQTKLERGASGVALPEQASKRRSPSQSILCQHFCSIGSRKSDYCLCVCVLFFSWRGARGSALPMEASGPGPFPINPLSVSSACVLGCGKQASGLFSPFPTDRSIDRSIHFVFLLPWLTRRGASG